MRLGVRVATEQTGTQRRHPEIQRVKLRQVQAEELFDAVLVGGEEVQAGAAEKPAASIFLTACRLAQCEPHEVRAPPMHDTLASNKVCSP